MMFFNPGPSSGLPPWIPGLQGVRERRTFARVTDTAYLELFNPLRCKRQLGKEDKMKIVLFGPERRIGAWQSDKVIDLNRGVGKLFCATSAARLTLKAHADEKIPPRLERFIAAQAKQPSKMLSAPSSMRQSTAQRLSSTMLRASSSTRLARAAYRLRWR